MARQVKPAHRRKALTGPRKLLWRAGAGWAGGTEEHCAVAANILAELGNALFGRGCRVATSDLRIKIVA